MSTVALYSEMKKSFSVNKQGCIKEAIQGNYGAPFVKKMI